MHSSLLCLAGLLTLSIAKPVEQEVQATSGQNRTLPGNSNDKDGVKKTPQKYKIIELKGNVPAKKGDPFSVHGIVEGPDHSRKQCLLASRLGADKEIGPSDFTTYFNRVCEDGISIQIVSEAPQSLQMDAPHSDSNDDPFFYLGHREINLPISPGKEYSLPETEIELEMIELAPMDDTSDTPGDEKNTATAHVQDTPEANNTSAGHATIKRDDTAVARTSMNTTESKKTSDVTGLADVKDKGHSSTSFSS
ncbi:hypothetical protein B9Z65_9085 [Elsinoe australis]|uniref:Uncharacterized protein n=1 Tax=Elsinoe australis TaxID=40998 RepID=A0A2P8ABR4_9PEZI|nr:hypothetical protein B9Z65_9085 [Elsinoe australis]